MEIVFLKKWYLQLESEKFSLWTMRGWINVSLEFIMFIERHFPRHFTKLHCSCIGYWSWSEVCVKFICTIVLSQLNSNLQAVIFHHIDKFLLCIAFFFLLFPSPTPNPSLPASLNISSSGHDQIQTVANVKFLWKSLSILDKNRYVFRIMSCHFSYNWCCNSKFTLCFISYFKSFRFWSEWCSLVVWIFVLFERLACIILQWAEHICMLFKNWLFPAWKTLFFDTETVS